MITILLIPVVYVQHLFSEPINKHCLLRKEVKQKLQVYLYNPCIYFFFKYKITLYLNCCKYIKVQITKSLDVSCENEKVYLF